MPTVTYSCTHAALIYSSVYGFYKYSLILLISRNLKLNHTQSYVQNEDISLSSWTAYLRGEEKQEHKKAKY